MVNYLTLKCDEVTYQKVQAIKYIHNKNNPNKKLTMIEILAQAITEYYKKYFN